MSIGEATVIFNNIESDLYSAEEKMEAISEVLNMATHNGITKEAMLNVIHYMFPLAYW